MCNLYSGQRRHPGAAHCPQCVGCTTTDDVSALSSTPCNKNEGYRPRERQESVALHTLTQEDVVGHVTTTQKSPPRKTLLVLKRCTQREAQVQRTLLVQTVGSTGREPKPPVAVTIGAASAAGAGAKYSSTCASAAKKCLCYNNVLCNRRWRRVLCGSRHDVLTKSEHEVRALRYSFRGRLVTLAISAVTLKECDAVL